MVTPAAPAAATDWKKMKVQELRDELSNRGLDTTGLKSALVERLEAAVPKEAEDGVAKEDADMKDTELDVNDGVPDAGNVETESTDEPTRTEISASKGESGADPEPTANVVPPADEAVGSSAAAVQSSVPVTNGSSPVPSTDLEKKQRRAERFGLELMVSEGEKRRLRAARFGDPVESKVNGAASKMSPTTKDAEAIKRKARAERFGIEQVADKPALTTDESKKKARLARFGADIKLDPQEQEKKKLRAARFGVDVEAKPEVKVESKGAVEQSVAT